LSHHARPTVPKRGTALGRPLPGFLNLYLHLRAGINPTMARMAPGPRGPAGAAPTVKIRGVSGRTTIISIVQLRSALPVLQDVASNSGVVVLVCDDEICLESLASWTCCCTAFDFTFTVPKSSRCLLISRHQLRLFSPRVLDVPLC
jgi:hypothetical protein